MLKSLIRLIIIICLIYLWVLNPIPFVLFEDTLQNQNQSISQSQQIMSIRSGAFDPLQQRPKDLTTLGESRKSDSGGEAPKPKKAGSPDNLSPGKKGIKYKPSPGSGNGGSGNSNVDFPKDVDPDKSISDPGFWNTLENLGDSEDESEPAEAPKPSTPTGILTKEAVRDYDYTTNPISPFPFRDWEGENKVIKSKELKKTLYAHGYQAGVVSSEDLVPCPIQEDPDLFQRVNCAKITDEGLDRLRNKIINLATSTKSGMVKIELPMPYYDTELAVGHLDMTTGDCAFFHQNGKYWSYKKYTPNEVKNLLPKCDSVKIAKRNQKPRPEL